MPTVLNPCCRRNVSLASYTTMRVGGPAKFFAAPALETELLEILDWARSLDMRWVILGKGSNIIFPEEGFDGLVITLLHFEKDRVEARPESRKVTASAGVHLYRLALAARDAGLGGAEFLANIPGTLGGALAMNAGFSRHPRQFNEIGDLVQSAEVLTAAGAKEILNKEALEFSYRASNLHEKIILRATLQLWKRAPEHINREMQHNFRYRNEEQDLTHPSSGSIFKNPSGQKSAGKLIEDLELKGHRIGDAMISPKHGNYFVNLGNAKSRDLIDLIRFAQKRVHEATGIKLDPEVRIIENS